MTEGEMAKFGRIAADEAMRAAVDYACVHGKREALAANADAIVVAIRAHVLAGFDAAMRDVREAATCGMGRLVGATFLASMRLAGINAAKEILGPPLEIEPTTTTTNR